MTKYILVSGGVVSGIGKGIIGAFDSSKNRPPYLCHRALSLFDWPTVEDRWPQGHCYQDRSLYEYRRWNDAAHRTW